jgi:site-specific DNA-methyltransferase (adenine-specific)
MNKKYQVIYADPPWSYKNKKTGGSMNSGSESKYPVMTLEEIKNMKIPSDDNSVLFLWATVPLLPEALEVMRAWGFKYKTMITWRKIMSLGMGYWWRGQTEHLLFGIKGKIKAFRVQEPNFIQCKVEKHSQKPDVFRQLIERSIVGMEKSNKLELFARKKIDGWDVFGDEVDNSIKLLE